MYSVWQEGFYLEMFSSYLLIYPAFSIYSDAFQ